MSSIVPAKVGNVPKRRKKPKKPEVGLAIRFSALNINQNVLESFEDMGLSDQLLRGIHNYGLEKPAFIQQRAIVPCIGGQDAIVQAQSGMGKTAALVIAVLQRLDRSDPQCQALVLAPTRELAEQIQQVFQELSKFMIKPNVTSYTCVGGRGDMKKCKKACRAGRQVIIGTLGRTVHMLIGDGDEYGPHLSTDGIKTLALDEADQLLDGTYGRDLTTVLEKIPPAAQVILMSATMPGNILKLAWRFMRNPVTFLVRDFQLTLDGIRQYYVNVADAAEKILTVVDLFPIIEKSRGMIFCNMRATVVRVKKKLVDAGHVSACITGDMTQRDRDEIMAKFRRGERGYRVLITSDLLGRGIDVQQINLVVNYDLPTHKETYIHRVGRAGRYGRKGLALSFVETKELKMFEGIKAFYQTDIQPMPAEQEFLAQLGQC
ncbi:Eukaryotic initiation factor 4A [Folsomia candida]|uniref:RNA helicase n=1 Tax=Folsomia candida TaxID=158441 RepID=A0A226EPF4_FOLCA|nr:Eukaryotic initiation factor 4A [Folsomia candida]